MGRAVEGLEGPALASFDGLACSGPIGMAEDGIETYEGSPDMVLLAWKECKAYHNPE